MIARDTHLIHLSNAQYHERTAAQAYGAFRRAIEDGRWLDAATFAVEALTLHDVGYGGQLPAGALTHLSEALDGLTSDDGVHPQAVSA